MAQSLIFRGAEEALDLADEAVELHRLGIVIVAAGLDGLFAVSLMACAVSPITGTPRVASSALRQRVEERAATKLVFTNC